MILTILTILALAIGGSVLCIFACLFGGAAMLWLIDQINHLRSR